MRAGRGHSLGTPAHCCAACARRRVQGVCMPSAHAAGSSALAVIIGFEYGFNTVFFALAAVFAMVTMFDAQGVRRSTGKQAAILNKVLDDIYWKGKIEEDRLKELIGHTPIEVFMGSIIGILLAIIFQR